MGEALSGEYAAEQLIYEVAGVEQDEVARWHIEHLVVVAMFRAGSVSHPVDAFGDTTLPLLVVAPGKLECDALEKYVSILVEGGLS